MIPDSTGLLEKAIRRIVRDELQKQEHTIDRYMTRDEIIAEYPSLGSYYKIRKFEADTGLIPVSQRPYIYRKSDIDAALQRQYEN